MEKKVKVGDVFKFRDGSIGIVIGLSMSVNQIKMRKIRRCVGKCSKKERIGFLYTYQYYTSTKCILKKTRKVGVEELLNLLWRDG